MHHAQTQSQDLLVRAFRNTPPARTGNCNKLHNDWCMESLHNDSGAKVQRSVVMDETLPQTHFTQF